MVKKFSLKYFCLQRDMFHGKWQIGLTIVSVIGQLVINGPGQCDCGSQTNSNDCANVTPNSTELAEVCQGSTSDGCAYCEWMDAYENNPGYCTPTADSSNCPQGVNGVSCSDDLGHARIKDKRSAVKTQRK